DAVPIRSLAARVFPSLLLTLAAAAQQPTPPSPGPTPATPPVVTPAPQENARRLELNLLGKTDAAAGESRRNENIQFNLVDNNALKELNVRLGTTATIVREFSPGSG